MKALITSKDSVFSLASFYVLTQIDTSTIGLTQVPQHYYDNDKVYRLLLQDLPSSSESLSELQLLDSNFATSVFDLSLIEKFVVNLRQCLNFFNCGN